MILPFYPNKSYPFLSLDKRPKRASLSLRLSHLTPPVAEREGEGEGAGRSVKMDEINVHDRTVTSKYRPDYDFSRKHHHRYHDQHVAKRSSKSAKSWWNSPETKRKTRVARYKLYAVEGKVKSSIKKGLCWVKRTCYRIIHL
jgi:hypothetical protein